MRRNWPFLRILRPGKKVLVDFFSFNNVDELQCFFVKMLLMLCVITLFEICEQIFGCLAQLGSNEFSII